MSYLFDANFERIKGAFSSPIPKPFTIVAWVRRSNASWLDPSAVTWVDLNDDEDDLNSQHLIGNLATAQRAGVRAREEADGSFHQSGPVWGDTRFDDVWVTVIGCFRSDTDRQGYANAGILAGAGTTNSDPTNDAQYISIGGAGHTNFDLADAYIAEVAIFDKALSTGEMALLESASGTGPPPNTVAPANCIGYWPLLDDQTNHPDQSGNGGPTLTVAGSPTHSALHPTITAVGEVFNRVLTENTVITDPTDGTVLRLALERPANSNVESLTDSIRTFFSHGRDAIENFSLADAFTIRQHLRRQLIDAANMNDVLQAERFLTRALSDDAEVNDDLTKNITIGDTSETFFRTKKDVLRLTDTAIPTFLGINDEQLDDALSLSDFAFLRWFRSRSAADQLEVVTELLRMVHSKVRTDTFRMSDNVIVTATRIWNITMLDTFSLTDDLVRDLQYKHYVELSDGFNVFDDTWLETGTTLKPAVPIETGIEER